MTHHDDKPGGYEYVTGWLRSGLEMTRAEADQFWAGYDAAKAGIGAAACPWNASKVELMAAWLQGHVTATEERPDCELPICRLP